MQLVDGNCSTTYEGKEVEIQDGETKWLNPCYFCWCYGDETAGCNSVDCPWHLECEPGFEMKYVEGQCCPECVRISD